MNLIMCMMFLDVEQCSVTFPLGTKHVKQHSTKQACHQSHQNHGMSHPENDDAKIHSNKKSFFLAKNKFK